MKQSLRYDHGDRYENPRAFTNSRSPTKFPPALPLLVTTGTRYAGEWTLRSRLRSRTAKKKALLYSNQARGVSLWLKLEANSSSSFASVQKVSQGPPRACAQAKRERMSVSHLIFPYALIGGRKGKTENEQSLGIVGHSPLRRPFLQASASSTVPLSTANACTKQGPPAQLGENAAVSLVN